jgi:N-acetylneuraminic acid mutarotase
MMSSTKDTSRSIAFATMAMTMTMTMTMTAACGCSDGGGSGEPPLPEGWRELAAMEAGLGEAAAALWDGKIYVAGGFDTSKAAQVLDVAKGTWQRIEKLPAGTDNAGAAAADGKIYVVGGEGAALQIYDVASGTWSLGAAPPRPRFASVVERIGDELHLVGGWSFDRSNNVSLRSHDVYDLRTGAYRARAEMPTARNHALSGVIDGKLYVTGGRAPGHEGADASNVSATEVYDPATDQWSAGAALPTPRSGGASAVLDGKLYVLGGGLPGNSVHAVIERYDPATDRWEQLGEMPAAFTGHRALAFEGSLYVFGGFSTREGMRNGTLGSPRAYRYTPVAP